MMDNNTRIGIIGAGIVLIAFILNQTGRLTAKSYSYDLLNFIGSSILVFYAVLIASYPFAILNTIWAFVSVKDIFLAFSKNK